MRTSTSLEFFILMMNLELCLTHHLLAAFMDAFTDSLSFFDLSCPSIGTAYSPSSPMVKKGTSPFSPALCSKTHAPSPVEDCRVPSTKYGGVSRYVRIYGWVGS